MAHVTRETCQQANLAVMATLNLEIGRIEARLLEGVKLRPDYAWLKTIPGIGEVLAIVIMLETGDVTRFAQVGNFASYARCVDSACYSNGRKKGEGNSKNGNAYLVWAFIEAANFARRYSDEAKPDTSAAPRFLWGGIPPGRRQFIARRLIHLGDRHDSVVASIEETDSA